MKHPSLALLALAMAAPAAAQTAPQYVAMGSSFAAGPGVAMDAAHPAAGNGGRCMRSPQNYPSQLAAKRGLALVDVSCSGATTNHILGPWADIPAQADALTADTALVTITIGGNDLNYLGGLMAASCAEEARRKADTNAHCMTMPAPDDATFAKVEANMRAIAKLVQTRAPKAKLVFVTYLTILPKPGVTCPTAPLAADKAAQARATAARLALLTARVARETHTLVLASGPLSITHDVCAKTPWVSDFGPYSRGIVPYHPNLAGMTAIANALDAMLPKTLRK